MHLPRGLYQVEGLIEEHVPVLTPAQRCGLALWVLGSVLAHSACQNAVATALEAAGSFETVRQRLREWVYDGQDKRARCRAQVEVSVCFVWLLRWVLGWWRGEELALALDATNQRDELTVLVVSVLYRGAAVPVAWWVVGQRQKGSWLPAIRTLVLALVPAVPGRMRVLFMADAGLWSRSIWKAVQEAGWRPLMRITSKALFTPDGEPTLPARCLVEGPGQAWVGHGVAFRPDGTGARGASGPAYGRRHKPKRASTPDFPTGGRRRLPSTLVVVWAEGYKEPWVLLTDEAPEKTGVWWYALRMWMELGFRALKGFGWRVDRTRRTDPGRASRHWLVLAVSTLCVLACGTRLEDAQAQGVSPARLRSPRKGAESLPQGEPSPYEPSPYEPSPYEPSPYEPTRQALAALAHALAGAAARSGGRLDAAASGGASPRRVSVFARGLQRLARLLYAGRLWRRWWLAPEPWPPAPPGLQVTRHGAPI